MHNDSIGTARLCLCIPLLLSICSCSCSFFFASASGSGMGLVWVWYWALGLGWDAYWCDVCVFCSFAMPFSCLHMQDSDLVCSTCNPGLDVTCHSLPSALWSWISGMLCNGRKKLFIDLKLLCIYSCCRYIRLKHLDRKAVPSAVNHKKLLPPKKPAITSYLNISQALEPPQPQHTPTPIPPAMAHSKRNTSLPHFTSYERNLLRSTWGTKRSVIGRDSFLPFASCRLCLQPARAPVVACASNGDLFCRECAINDLLAQRQEIKRLERDREEARKRIKEDEERMLEEARRKELRDFEMVSIGLAGNVRKRKAGGGEGEEQERERALAAFKAREVEVDGKRRKVFELDEKEMVRVARQEEERLKEEMKREKVCRVQEF